MGKGLNLRESKYKKTVDAVYGENGPNTHNIQSLQQYALMTPGKLPKIGKYVANHAKDGLKDKKKGLKYSYSTIRTSMTIFNELIKTCHGDLALFASPICEVMELLLKSNSVDRKSIATETFIRFAEHGGARLELEKYVPYFFDMSNHTNNAEIEEEKAMRYFGLRALSSYIINTEDLDNMIKQFVDTSDSSQVKIFPIFLDNMQYSDEGRTYNDQNISEEVKNASIAGLARTCLKNMAARANHITVRPLCLSMLLYLDENNLWVPNDFAVVALTALSVGVTPHLYSTTIRFLLEHLDGQSEDATEVKISIINCLKQLMPQSITQQSSEVLSSVVRHITTEEGQVKEALSSEGISCISYIIKKQNNPLHQLDSVRDILSHLSSTPPMSEQSKMILYQSVTEVIPHLKKISSEISYPPSFLEQLCCLSNEDENFIVREQGLITFKEILQKFDIGERMGSNKLHRWIGRFNSFLVEHTCFDNNRGIHYQHIFDIHKKILCHTNVAGAVALLPKLFYLKQLDLSPSQAGAVPSLVLALFGILSEQLTLTSLSSYLDETHTKRKEAKQLSRLVTTDLTPTTSFVSTNAENEDGIIDILLEKERVLECLKEHKTLTSLCDFGQFEAIPAHSQVANLKSKEEGRRKRKGTPTHKRQPDSPKQMEEEVSAATFRNILEALPYSELDTPSFVHSYAELSAFLDVHMIQDTKERDHFAECLDSLYLECKTEQPSSILDITFPPVVNFL